MESPHCPLVYPHLQTLGDTYHLGSGSPRGNTGNREITGMGPHWRGRGDGHGGVFLRQGRLRQEEWLPGDTETTRVSRAKAQRWQSMIYSGVKGGVLRGWRGAGAGEGTEHTAESRLGPK